MSTKAMDTYETMVQQQQQEINELKWKVNLPFL